MLDEKHSKRRSDKVPISEVLNTDDVYVFVFSCNMTKCKKNKGLSTCS